MISQDSKRQRQNTHHILRFYHHYHRVLSQGVLSSFITLLNTAVPVRNFIPIEANRGYVFSCAEIRRMTLECVHQRVREFQVCNENGEKPPHTGDILSLIVEERKSFLGTNDEMTELEISDQVCLALSSTHSACGDEST